MATGRTVKLYNFSGSHSAMGRQQGRETAALIAQSKKLLAESEEMSLIKPGFVPAGVFVFLGEIKTWFQYSHAIAKNFPRQSERMNGIARGAGVRPGFITLLQSFEIELNKLNFHVGACSAAGICAPKSAGGEPLVIKNFDYPVHFTDQYITRVDEPEGRFKVLSVSAAPLAGNHDGINEHGLVISYNYGYGQDAPRHNVPITMVVQEALETCATTEQAVDFISRAPRRGGALLMICDASGDLRAMELSNRRSAERMPKNGVLVNTNHYLATEMLDIDVPKGAVYTEKNVRALRGCEVRASSERRYARALELLEKAVEPGEAALKEIFRDHGPDGAASDNTICRHADYFNTTCSVIFNPRRRSMKVMYDYPCSAEYTEFSLE